MPMPSLSWIPALPPPVHITNTTIHIWKTRLSHPFLQSHCTKYLSQSELHRALAYRNTTALTKRESKTSYYPSQARRNFVACRACLRDILSRYLPNTPPPQTISLQIRASGKPALCPPNQNLRFNLSHTADTALFAISSHIHIGIDLESTRRHFSNIHALIRRKLTSREQTLLFRQVPTISATQLSSSQALRGAMLLMWTRKEAFLKCTGEGITRGLMSFEVSASRQEPRILSVDGDAEKAKRWSLYNVPVDRLHVASVVAETAERAELQLIEWSPRENSDC